jgi:polysaccharide chain length determinant protein (PEP-CTERM system associated)
MPLRPNMEQSDYLDIFRRRKWVIVFSVLIILFGATVYCVLAPDQYRSTVKIRIIPPAVPEGMVRSNVNISTDDRLLIIRQDILSKSRLLGLVNTIGISTLGFNGMSSDAMVQSMRERISVGGDNDPKKKQKTDSKSPLDPNMFMLSCYHEDPKVANFIVSHLASTLVGENIRSREAVTRGTTEFLQSEMVDTRKRLEQQEEKLKRYKIQFGGELPQQEASNLNRLTRLQEQIKSNSDTIARLGDRKILLESQIRTAGNAAKDGIPGGEKVGSYDFEESLLAELGVRRKKLEELQNKYTLLHPAAVQARNDIAQLEARIANLRRTAKNEEGISGAPAATPSEKPSVANLQRGNIESREVRSLREQIAAIDLETAALKRESASASRTIDQVQRQMERLPQREQELISLTRDYDNIKASYDGLLKKQIESRISEKLEEKQKGEQFQIMEPANLPIAPFKPERLKVLGLALLASLVIGAGGSIGLEMMDPTLRGSKEFKSFFDIPILASLPVIEDDRLKHRGAVRRAAVVGGLVSILGAYLIFLALHGERVLSILQSIGSSIGGKN